MKNRTEIPAGRLRLNTVLEKLWQHILVDLITKLPVSMGYDLILVVCDMFSKMLYFIVIIEKIMAKGLVKLFRDNMWKLYGLSKSVILDRGPQFITGLMKELNEMLEIETKLLTVFHLQRFRECNRLSRTIQKRD